MTRSIGSSQARWRGQPQDERGSIAILLMVVLVGLSLSALLVPMVITQAQTTRFDKTRVQTLNAAQSGLDVALGLIRASAADGVGERSQLPCGRVSGTVNGPGTASYSVDIEYFVLDPSIIPAKNQMSGMTPGAMICNEKYGNLDHSGATPGFAVFRSTGTDGAATDGSTAGRTLTATYVFRSSNANTLGGLVKIAPKEIDPKGEESLCMDAGSPTPPADALVVLHTCGASTPPAAQQIFAYRSDLTLQLVSSITPAYPNGLCVSSTGKRYVLLLECGPWNQPVTPRTQQWSYNDRRQFEAAQASSAKPGESAFLCMNSQVASQPITLEPCDPKGSAGVWLPSPSVGSGAAGVFQVGSGSNQWVNYHQFGRCLAVDGQEPKKANMPAGTSDVVRASEYTALSSGSPAYLIDQPCQQHPIPAIPTERMLFQAPAIPAGEANVTGQISTNNQADCLTSRGTIGDGVTLEPCKSGGTAQNWTIHGGDKSLDYSTKYTVVNGTLCLALSAPSKEPEARPTVLMQTCNGTTEQKWNAAPDLLNGEYGPASALKNTHEN